MNKITLVRNINARTSFNSSYLEPIFSEYFNLVEFDSNVNYHKLDTVFVTNCWDSVRPTSWVLPLYDQGYKVLIDNLPEVRIAHSLPDAYTLFNKNWFWYNESLLFKDLNYDSYIPDRTYEKTALMLIRRVTNNRTKLVNALKTRLDNFLYSYVGKNVFIEGDSTTDTMDVEQRYFNPDWYNRTCFSLVVESLVQRTDFITEKTFKPIAFKHPFMVFGQIDTLSNLHKLGFETFNNLFDESYDKISDVNKKIDKLIENIDNYRNRPFDSYTLGKLNHNYNLFYNTGLVLSKFKEEIIRPMIEYAEST